MGNYPLCDFFFHIPVSSQASIVWFSYLFPFVPIWTSVWSSVLHTNFFGAFFFFFLAWLGVITVFHFIFINLLHSSAFHLLLILIVSVCERGSVHASGMKLCICFCSPWQCWGWAVKNWQWAPQLQLLLSRGALLFVPPVGQQQIMCHISGRVMSAIILDKVA